MQLTLYSCSTNINTTFTW